MLRIFFRVQVLFQTAQIWCLSPGPQKKDILSKTTFTVFETVTILADSKLLISDPDSDPTLQLITDLDATFHIILDSDLTFHIIRIRIQLARSFWIWIQIRIKFRIRADPDLKQCF